ncbi:hypothetical protein PHYC_00426 [Phycisphaerales bacterium]|nr:hypothetical protein PHYC_00426 [Phycisphaerales bacterium]
MIRFRVMAAAAAAMFPAIAFAQHSVLVADRTNGAIWRLEDANSNGVIDEPAEVHLYFDGANAAGTPGPLNPNTIGARADGYVVYGDQDSTRRLLVWMIDRNCDGDAQDEGESGVLADPNNGSGVSFAFPTGIAFDAMGRLFVTNAGNTFGNDGIYRLADLNADGDSMDAGEVSPFVTDPFFGPGNGAYSPQEILIVDPEGDCYLRNSSSGLHGIYRFRDLNANGRADDAGETSLWFGAGNAAGITLSAGFALEISANQEYGYMHNLATGGLDQIIRVQDTNDDGDAMDSGEAAVAFSTAEAGFVSIDITSLPDGTVLFSDNSTLRIIALRDNDGDGLFLGTTERTDYLANSSGLLAAVRAMTRYTPPNCGNPCDPDVNCDGAVNGFDIQATEEAVNGDFSNFCQASADLNGDGSENGFDIETEEQRVNGEPC